MDTKGSVKLCDFGLASIIGDDSLRTTMVGTTVYMAPERLRARPYGRSSDLWSFGLVILEASIRFEGDAWTIVQISSHEYLLPFCCVPLFVVAVYHSRIPVEESRHRLATCFRRRCRDRQSVVEYTPSYPRTYHIVPSASTRCVNFNYSVPTVVGV